MPIIDIINIKYPILFCKMTYHFSYLFKTNEITKSFFEIHFLIKFRSHVPLDFAGKHREKKERRKGRKLLIFYFNYCIINSCDAVLLCLLCACCCVCT